MSQDEWERKIKGDIAERIAIKLLEENGAEVYTTGHEVLLQQAVKRQLGERSAWLTKEFTSHLKGLGYSDKDTVTLEGLKRRSKGPLKPEIAETLAKTHGPMKLQRVVEKAVRSVLNTHDLNRQFQTNPDLTAFHKGTVFQIEVKYRKKATGCTEEFADYLHYHPGAQILLFSAQPPHVFLLEPISAREEVDEQLTRKILTQLSEEFPKAPSFDFDAFQFMFGTPLMSMSVSDRANAIVEELETNEMIVEEQGHLTPEQKRSWIERIHNDIAQIKERFHEIYSERYARYDELVTHLEGSYGSSYLRWRITPEPVGAGSYTQKEYADEVFGPRFIKPFQMRTSTPKPTSLATIELDPKTIDIARQLVGKWIVQSDAESYNHSDQRARAILEEKIRKFNEDIGTFAQD